MTKTKAFVSYSWTTEQQNGIVNTIGTLCIKRGITLIRDNEALKHGELIDRFLDELTKGDHVITVFSKPYFQSKWCMYELLRIYQRGEFEQRTHPVIADNCDLQSQSYRLELVKFWQEQQENAETAIQGLDPKVVLDEHRRVKLYRDIYQNINELMNFAAGRLTIPLAELHKQNYAPLLDRIKLAPKPDNSSHKFSDVDFMAEIRQALESDLNKSEAFRDLVLQNCDKDFGGGEKLPDYLINQCLAGKFVAVIQNLQSALLDSVEATSPSDVITVKKIHDIAEGIVSKLVLFNVKNEWMQQYRQDCLSNGQGAYELPEMSFGSVELVTSREAKAIPKFQIDQRTRSLQGGKGLAWESGIKSKDVVSDIIKRLYVKVMECKLTAEWDEQRAIDDLKRTLQQRKQQKNLKLKKNYFILMPNAESLSALTVPDVQAKLKDALPDLAFIHLKSNSAAETFIVEDADLMVAIREFFNTLEGSKSS